MRANGLVTKWLAHDDTKVDGFVRVGSVIPAEKAVRAGIEIQGVSHICKGFGVFFSTYTDWQSQVISTRCEKGDF